VHWHRKPARSFREVTSHDLRMAVLEEALLGRASLFPLAFLDCSGFPNPISIPGWLLFLLKSSGTGSSCLGYCEASFHRERR
jgi:hypothetical protein